MSGRSRRSSTTSTAEVSEVKAEEQPTVAAQPTTQTAPELSPEQREFLDAMNNLILSAQELSYALALLPNELVETHQELKELVESARSVVRATWRFHKLIKHRVGR